MSIIIFIIILAVLILVHEFGHFIAAKRLGIRVDEFGMGFPPRIWGYKAGETVYSVNWIPFGGFVKIFGEDPDEGSLEGPERERSFALKPRWMQAVVLVAGIGFNVLFAWLILSVGFMSGMPTAVDDSIADRVTDARLMVIDVERDTPADEAGLAPGDRILSLERAGDSIAEPSVEDARTFIARSEEPITIYYERGGKPASTVAVPRSGIVADRPAIGISMELVGTLRERPDQAIISGFRATQGMFIGTFAGFGVLIRDAFRGSADLSQITGPVGIAAHVGNVAQTGFINLLSFVAFISVNLAVINLMPFPALDGGRLFFVFIEAIRRKRINPQIVSAVNAVGFVVLVGLMLVVTYRDIVRLF